MGTRCLVAANETDFRGTACPLGPLGDPVRADSSSGDWGVTRFPNTGPPDPQAVEGQGTELMGQAATVKGGRSKSLPSPVCPSTGPGDTRQTPWLGGEKQQGVSREHTGAAKAMGQDGTPSTLDTAARGPGAQVRRQVGVPGASAGWRGLAHMS